MNVVNTGAIYRIYDDHLQVTEQLPARQYVVRCSEMSGFFLEEYANPNITESKIYGVHDNKIKKVLRSFKQFTRNLGVILSGDKGIGKSLFAKLLAEKAIEAGMAVIIVDQYIPGVHSFIESIDQEVLVIFDEFEKTFANRDGMNGATRPMDTMLSLFDGLSAGKKLFVITCNSFNSLNDFMINRPGRFHYHFRFEYPCADEVREYLHDKLGDGYDEEIAKVVQFSARVNLNYDCLRAITYELSCGESFEDAILDLNILNLDDQYYSVEVVCADGEHWYAPKIRLNLFNSTTRDLIWVEDDNGRRNGFNVSFIPSKAEYVSFEQGSVIRGADVKLDVDEEFYEDSEYKVDKAAVEKARSRKVSHVMIKKIFSGNKYQYTV